MKPRVVDLSLDMELVFTLVPILLILLGLLAWLQQLFFLAGVCFILFTFSIYIRETRF